MDAAGAPVSARVTAWRGWLLITGAALLGIGGLTFLSDVKPSQYLGVIAWMAGAIILHDGVGAMVVFGVTVLLRRAPSRIPFVVLAIVQGALVVGAIVVVLVAPEIVKQAIGTANPSILPLDYVGNLALFAVVLAAATVVAVLVAIIVTVRRRPQQAERAAARKR
ncbi:hypothetical protein BH11ACT3_BH11ACT3_19870 [soil metagenome]